MYDKVRSTGLLARSMSRTLAPSSRTETKEKELKHARIYMVYKAKDLILYIFSLTMMFLISYCASTELWQIVITFSMLLYLLVIFVLKHGFELDFSSIRLILMEVTGYIRIVLADFGWNRRCIILITLSYGLSLAAEKLFINRIDGTFWVMPFPYLTIFYIHFLLITGYRTLILVAHLRKSKVVIEFLKGSPWKTQLSNLSGFHHIVHAYVTGILCHIALVLPLLVIYKYFVPTYFRELCLVVFVFLVDIVLNSTNSTSNGLPHRADNFFLWFRTRHEHDHKNRFYFTVFHGHHHDAIPSGLIAATENGLLEGVHRSIVRMHFMYPASLFLLQLGMNVPINIVGHQYIPNVFPFSASVIRLKHHHAVHHLLNLLPLAFGYFPYLQNCVDQGYNPSNAKARWFADSVVKLEEISKEDAEAFLTASNDEGIYIKYGEFLKIPRMFARHKNLVSILLYG